MTAPTGPDDRLFNKPGGPADPESTGLLGPTPSQDLLFERIFKQGTQLGIGPGQIPISTVEAAGGIDAIQRSQAPRSRVIGPLLDAADTALGQPTGSAQAAGLEELSPLQQGMLFVSDIVAMAEGRMMPSQLLAQQGRNAISAQVQLNREGFLRGMDGVQKHLVLIQRLSPDKRLNAALDQQAFLNQQFGEGVGDLLVTLAGEPTTGESLLDVIQRPEFYEGTGAEQLIMMMTMLAPTKPDLVAELMAGAITKTDEGGSNIFELTTQSQAPAQVFAKLDSFYQELRDQGGESAEFADRAAKGHFGTTTPEEILRFDDKLPENSPNRLTPAQRSALERVPHRFLNVFPGLRTAEMLERDRRNRLDGELSTPKNFINTVTGELAAMPMSSNRALALMATGDWMLLEDGLGITSGGALTTSNLLSIRKDFISSSEDFREKAKPAWDAIRRAAARGGESNDNAPADLAMIFAFMKMIDLGSVVRESEFRAAAAARGMDQALIVKLNNVRLKEGRLSSVQRKKFLQVAQDIYLDKVRDQIRLEEQMFKSAQAFGVENRNQAVVDYVDPGTRRALLEGDSTFREELLRVQNVPAGKGEPTEAQVNEIKSALRAADIPLTQDNIIKALVADGFAAEGL